MAKITIIGLGLIGGSIGLALKQAAGGYEIVGHDRNPEAGGKAKRRGAVDRAEWNLPQAVADAALVIIATPAGAVEQVLRDVAPHLRPDCVVTDTASTKAQIIAAAPRILPEGISFVGGHPMAGKETSGIEGAEAGLFQGCTYCIVPAPGARDEAVNLVVGLVSAVGAKPLFIDPVEHDSYVAAISHLPYLAAVSLVKVAAGSPAWRDIAKVAASGFRDTTRVASGDTTMHRDICLTNREALLRWLDAYLGEVAAFRALLAAGDGSALERALRQAKEARDEWQREREGRPARTVEGISGGDQLRQLLVGGWGARKDEKRR